LVLEDGGDEDEAHAALLHDGIFDQGGAVFVGWAMPTLLQIKSV